MKNYAIENAELRARMLAKLAELKLGTPEHAEQLEQCRRMGYVK